MNFEKLNAAIALLPTKKMVDLDINQKYKVTEMKKVTTQFGPCIVLNLNDEFQLFLPDRVLTFFNDNDTMFTEMLEKIVNSTLSFVYLGDKKFEFMNM